MPPTRRRWPLRLFVLLAALPALAALLPYLVPLEVATAPIPARPFADSRFVVVDGLRVHLRQWAGESPRRGCPVLLVHGQAGSTFSWRALAPALARRGQDVVAVDLPGYGYSERRLWPAGDAAGLWRLLDALGPAATRWCLVGHSQGARVVGAMVEQAPARVAGAVYLAGTPIAPRAARPAWQRALARLPPVVRAATVYADRRLLRPAPFAELLASAYGRAPAPDEVEGYLAPLRVGGSTAAVLARELAPPPPPPRIAALRAVPSLVLWGREDRWIRFERGITLARVLGRARLAPIERAGHLPMETHPAETLGAMADWFDALPRAAGLAPARQRPVDTMR